MAKKTKKKTKKKTTKKAAAKASMARAGGVTTGSLVTLHTKMASFTTGQSLASQMPQTLRLKTQYRRQSLGRLHALSYGEECGLQVKAQTYLAFRSLE